MSKIDKLLAKFYRKPIPNDITYEEMIQLAKYFGCRIGGGGKHSLHIVHPSKSWVIPIPTHGNTVKEIYIKQLKEMFDSIKEGSKNDL